LLKVATLRKQRRLTFWIVVSKACCASNYNEDKEKKLAKGAMSSKLLVIRSFKIRAVAKILR